MPYGNKDAETTAPKEILRRIKELDREETRLTQRAGEIRGELRRNDLDREALAVKRRQYEFALKTLEPDVIHIPITVTGKPVDIKVHSQA